MEEQATKTTTSFMHEKIMYIATNEVNLHSDLTEVAMALLNEFPGIGPQQWTPRFEFTTDLLPRQAERERNIAANGLE